MITATVVSEMVRATRVVRVKTRTPADCNPETCIHNIAASMYYYNIIIIIILKQWIGVALSYAQLRKRSECTPTVLLTLGWVTNRFLATNFCHTRVQTQSPPTYKQLIVIVIVLMINNNKKYLYYITRCVTLLYDSCIKYISMLAIVFYPRVARH